MEDIKVIDGRYYRLCNTLRYAQEKGGQQLHLVYELGPNSVSRRALCGKTPEHWRMSINVPMGHACKNCLRAKVLRGK